MRYSFIMILAVNLFAISALADDPAAKESNPLSQETLTELTKNLDKSLQAASHFVELSPKSVNAYSQRGDALFFLGRFADSVADYDKMIELDESLKDSHWRRGIALFYAERFQDAAEQFESYHSFDQVDRENGIWRYLSQHRAQGQQHAREGLLKYQKDDREPFPAIYQLFGGKLTADEVSKQIAQADVPHLEREKRVFYAHLYIGLNFAVEMKNDDAQRHLVLATRNTWGADPRNYGPHYMWHVGRLHEAQLRTRVVSK